MKTLITRISTVIGLYAAAMLITPAPAAALTSADFANCSKGCQYNIVWDGHQGTLMLLADGSGWLIAGGNRHLLRHRSAINPQEAVTGGYRGPGYRTNSNLNHRVVFWVDFANTPTNASDDQMFDGYMMTQTKNAIAGITWWRNIAFGFYAYNKQPIR